MKKAIVLLLAIALLLSCMAGCATEEKPSESPSAASESTGGQTQSFKIGVAEMVISDESAARQTYLKDYIGPKYNCEFVFSEAIADTSAAMTFIENCASAGCDAIISCYNADTEQLLQKCQDLGMVFVENVARVPRSEAMFTGGYENFGGTFAEDQVELGKLFKTYLTENLDTKEEHGYIVCTSLSYNGHLQSVQVATAMLESLAEAYGLTYAEDISTYLASSSPMYAENDKNVPIYIYPDLYTADGYIQGLGAELQTGKYDYVLAAHNIYVAFGVTLDEIEQAYNKNIHVVCLGIPGEALTAAFETKDMFGNSTLDMSTTKLASIQSALPFIQVYNMLTGHGDCLNDENGEKLCLCNRFVAITSAEQLEALSGLDKDASNYVADYEFIDSCLGVNNPDLTGAQIAQNVADTIQSTLKDLQ